MIDETMMIDDNLSSHVFNQRNLRSRLHGGHLTPVSIPQIGLKKGMVNINTLKMMKKMLEGKNQIKGAK